MEIANSFVDDRITNAVQIVHKSANYQQRMQMY